MNIYLMGYMGSGKSTVGKKLSKALGLDFVDLDQQIESRINQSIAQYFQDHGADSFRELEKEELSKTFNLSNTVIALGGGTPCFFDNLELINKKGRSVYLKLSATSLTMRLENAKTPRPLIQGLASEELFEYVQQQLGEREKFYNRAHVIFKGENLKIDELAQLINTISE